MNRKPGDKLDAFLKAATSCGKSNLGGLVCFFGFAVEATLKLTAVGAYTMRQTRLFAVCALFVALNGCHLVVGAPAIPPCGAVAPSWYWHCISSGLAEPRTFNPFADFYLPGRDGL